MKLDKIKFARLVTWIASNASYQFNETDLQYIDDMIDIDVPQVKLPCSIVDELLREIVSPDGFIPAIKAYRAITGAGLKESKEAIERYRTIPKFTIKDAWDK